jgi:catechol 2,3-dioxygenase
MARAQDAMQLGPICLNVRDLDPTLNFYVRDIGLRVLHKDGDIVELAAGNQATNPLLVLRQSASAVDPPHDAAGLYHYAILLPDRRSLAAAYLAIGNRGVVFDGYADHLVSEALYLTDPEGNGIEIYADRPREQWKFDEDGQVQMATQPLDVDSLLKEVTGVPSSDLTRIPNGSKIGHVHLKVSNLQSSITFYQSLLGLELMSYWGSAAFLSVGGYHHHIGMNTWESQGGPPLKSGWIGLQSLTINVPASNAQEILAKAIDQRPVQDQGSGQFSILDPDEIEILVRPSA